MATRQYGKFLISLALTLSFTCVYAQQSDSTAGQLKSASCVACHGPDGNQTANPVWPKLAGQSVEYLTKELMDFKAGEKGGRNNPIMTPLATPLSTADITDLAAYYAHLPRTVGVADPKLVDLGQRLYRGGDLAKGIPACAACHSPSGLGNAPAAFPALSGQNADYIAEQLKAFRNHTRTNDLNQIMQDIAAKMNDQEIAAVASYVQGLH